MMIKHDKSPRLCTVPLVRYICAAAVLMIMLPLAVSAGGRKTGKTLAKAAVPELSYNDRLRFNYFFIEAVRQQNMGNLTAAFDLFEHARRINPRSAEVYYKESMYFAALENNDKSVEYMERAAALDGRNRIYRQTLAQNYLATHQYDKAIDAFEKLAAANHKDDTPLKMLLQLYQYKKDYKKMLSTLERLEVQDGVSEQLTLDKMHAYELLGDEKSSYGVLKDLADTHPNDLNYRVMLGNWLMQKDRKDEALACYRQVLAEDPTNNNALSSMYDYYTSTSQDSLASGLLTRLLLSEHTPMDTKTTLMRSFINKTEESGGDSTKVLALFNKVLAMKQNGDDMAELQLAYMDIKNMPADSIMAACRRVLAISPDNGTARLQLVQLLWQKQQLDDVLAACEPAKMYNPEDIAFYYFSGMAHFMRKENDAALDEFKKGVAQANVNSNADLVSDFYAIMGDIYHEKGMKEQAYASYDSCLQWKDDNMGCLNNYAYFLSVEGEQLKKAEEMSYKTVVSEPDNATFLDTYAWILFKEERYGDAKKYIDSAIVHLDTAMTNAEVIEHAGDIYAMNGLTDKAVDYWKKALDVKVDSKMLERKIKARKYISDDKK